MGFALFLVTLLFEFEGLILTNLFYWNLLNEQQMQFQSAFLIAVAVVSLAITPTIAMFGGNHTNPSDVPWDVAIVSFLGKVVCRGTIISEFTVLTLASCLPEKFGNFLVFTFYDTDENEKGLMLKIQKIHKHPQYESHRESHYTLYDLAIVELVETLTLDEKRIGVMPLNMVSVFPNVQYNQPFVVGFQYKGKQENRGKMTLDQPLLTSAECDRFGKHDFPDSMICAGLSGHKAGPCAADFGAGLIVNDGNEKVLVGVMATLEDYCEKTQGKIVYHRVSSHMQWIVNVHLKIILFRQIPLPTSLCACKPTKLVND